MSCGSGKKDHEQNMLTLVLDGLGQGQFHDKFLLQSKSPELASYFFKRARVKLPEAFFAQ